MGGGSGIRRIFWILFLAASVYMAVKIVPPWSGYLLLKSAVSSEAKNAHHYDDGEILEHIITDAGTLGVYLARDDITVERDDNRVGITVEYSVTVHFFGRYSKDFWYFIYSERSLRAT
ncbi:MAG: DUF4845 domain-containing protein [Deltaproteobacteria bacterium]|nr:DUF4845 domain-containing protein [Deltaproteobacteria bacterium]